MIFNIETKPLQDETPVLQEGLTEFINFHINKLSVNYIGNSNPSIPACVKCSHPARPFPNTYIYYFEITINNLNISRPSVIIGLTDETFILNNIIGTTKKSYGLRADGKLFHSPFQTLDFSHKFSLNDVVGCGIMFISRKVFFTRNGILLGRPFDLADNTPLFASACLTSLQDFISFNFLGPFKYKLDIMIEEEKSKVQRQVREEKVDCRDIFKLIKGYLEYQGYADTLGAFEEFIDLDMKNLIKNKSRSFSGIISERYNSTDLDPLCIECDTLGKLCCVCVKKIMETVEVGTNVRLPERYDRCDSVDLTSLYLKKTDFIEDFVKTPRDVKDVKQRGILRQVILKGNIKDVYDFIIENFPDMVNDELCMLYLAIQEFIEMVKKKNVYGALDFAREKLAEYKDFMVYYRDEYDVQIKVLDVFGVIAYEDPYDSPLKFLLGKNQLELTADLVNLRIVQKNKNGKSSLEEALKHVLCTQFLYQENILINTPAKISFAI
ncbi:hypothetical protein SteCoe_33438 [Stentor coeruleus]|uniref:B30.2/SPRY domain-containing protein n=1 Tax=Stentor coeruleus TaxID=5963 RepID=A0A1R2AWP4_9CILI|nr:hypothetical protein SteCoe_33438 [Stentor coeruleus]